MPDSIVTRTCNVCKIEKPIAEFPPIKIFVHGKSYTCRPCHAERCRDWQRRNKEKLAAYGRKSRQKNRDKTRARKKLNWHVGNGNIKVPNNCEQCGTEDRLQGHHHKGYTPENALNVIWLCQSCHNKTRWI